MLEIPVILVWSIPGKLQMEQYDWSDFVTPAAVLHSCINYPRIILSFSRAMRKLTAGSQLRERIVVTVCYYGRVTV
jgi:hypothetical protein